MEKLALLDIIETGEDSTTEFKQGRINQDSLSQEIVAFANTEGGLILFGIEDKTHNLVGIETLEADQIDKDIGNLVRDLIKPGLAVLIKRYILDRKLLLYVKVTKGENKPYRAKGKIYVRQGSLKRLLTDSDEILRLYQASGNLCADEMPVEETTVDDVDLGKVHDYLKRQNKEVKDIDVRLLQNLRIMRKDERSRLSLGGLLFFGKEPQRYKPVFVIKAVSFFGNSIGGTAYRESLDLEGTIPELFEGGIRFLKNNLKHTQQGQNFNLTGKLEVSEVALEELLQNALIHRDYLKNAPIRLLIFDDRIEIISPGKLPNSLTVENTKLGNTVVRNNLLVSYCSKLMKYRGLGSGISRALKEQPDIVLVNDREGEQFKVTLPRPQKV